MTSLSPPLQAVVALFEGPLSGVRFADVDAAGLSKLAAELASVAGEVEQHEAKLAELRQDLAQRQEALLALSQRALAYARVYAEDDEELLAKLNDIALPRAAKSRKTGATKTTTASPNVDDAAPIDSAASLADSTKAIRTGKRANPNAGAGAKANANLGSDADADADTNPEARPKAGTDADGADADGADADADADIDAPAKTKPAYARPKVKRRLGRATSQRDSV
jgi:hypothetical protein